MLHADLWALDRLAAMTGELSARPCIEIEASALATADGVSEHQTQLAALGALA